MLSHHLLYVKFIPPEIGARIINDAGRQVAHKKNKNKLKNVHFV